MCSEAFLSGRGVDPAKRLVDLLDTAACDYAVRSTAMRITIRDHWDEVKQLACEIHKQEYEKKVELDYCAQAGQKSRAKLDD